VVLKDKNWSFFELSTVFFWVKFWYYVSPGVLLLEPLIVIFIYVMSINITHRDGTKEPFNADHINRSIEKAAFGLTDITAKVMQIASETQLTLYDGITTDELDIATINASLQNAQEDIEFDKIATRLLLKVIYKRVLGPYKEEDFAEAHKNGFKKFIIAGIESNMIHKDLGEKFDLDRLASVLDTSRDELYYYSGLSSMQSRYLTKGLDGHAIETPQYFWMRVAMAMATKESDPNLWAEKFYHKMSRLEYLSAGSTNIGAGTNRSSLSNCYLMEVHDDMEHIGKTVSDVLLLSKATGGIGLSVTKLRAEGSLLSSNNTASSGPIPFLHIIDSAVRAVQRGGKKKGALCFYMENWHLNFQDFLDLKQNAGDDYRRARTANTAVFISDEFMRRVKAGEDWYLFDPKDVSDLNELYGDAFAKRYNEYCQMAEEGKIKLFTKMPASQQYKNILVMLETTSHPWLTWKDTINARALNNNTGTIHCSNLCTEVTLPTDRNNVAVCNLISVNLSKHIENGEINWPLLEESTRLATRQLDNLIDVNQPPIPEAMKADDENRAIGLGLMGFTDTIEKMGYSYEDQEAYDIADKVFEFISYCAIDESANLAKERGYYKNFPGSGWSKGMVPVDTLAVLEYERGEELTVPKVAAMVNPIVDWDNLRKKVKEGVRNATVMAIAPNANIGLVAGTSPGIDPRFAQMFSRNKISGKYLEVNPNLVADLKKENIWDKVCSKILANQGDISEIDEIPDRIKHIYKTSFSVSPYAFIEVAARAQKWVDQAISRNMYLETRDIDEVMKIYSAAWSKGLKTTYYLHMKPRHTAEQSTVSVNKSQTMGKIGFAGLRAKTAQTVTVESTDPMVTDAETDVKIPAHNNQPEVKVHLVADPQDALLCEGCQ
jgi:ribonucleoside-diphosphate reductase alpha chain